MTGLERLRERDFNLRKGTIFENFEEKERMKALNEADYQGQITGHIPPFAIPGMQWLGSILKLSFGLVLLGAAAVARAIALRKLKNYMQKLVYWIIWGWHRKKGKMGMRYFRSESDKDRMSYSSLLAGHERQLVIDAEKLLRCAGLPSKYYSKN